MSPKKLCTFFREYNFVSRLDFYGSSFLFQNVMLTVLLGEKFRSFSVAHASNLLITPCNDINVTLKLLLVMYIARSSAKCDPSAPFPCCQLWLSLVYFPYLSSILCFLHILIFFVFNKNNVVLGISLIHFSFIILILNFCLFYHFNSVVLFLPLVAVHIFNFYLL